MNRIESFKELDSRANANCAVVLIGEYLKDGYLKGVRDFCKRHNWQIFFSTIGRRERVADDSLFATGQLRAPAPQELDSEVEKDNLINLPLEAGFDLVSLSDGRKLSDLLNKCSEFRKFEISQNDLEEFRSASEVQFKKRLDEFCVQLAPRLEKFDYVLYVHAMAGGTIRHPLALEGLAELLKGTLNLHDYFKTGLGRAANANINEVSSQTFNYLIDAIKTNAAMKNLKNEFRIAGYGYHGTKIEIAGAYKWMSLPPYFPAPAKVNLEKISEKNFASGVSCTVFNSPEVVTASSRHFPGISLSSIAFLGSLSKGGHLASPLFSSRFQSETQVIKGFDIEKLSKIADQFFNHPMFKTFQIEQWPQTCTAEISNEIRLAQGKITEVTTVPGFRNLTSALSRILIALVGEILVKESVSAKEPIYWAGHDVIIEKIKQNYFEC